MEKWQDKVAVVTGASSGIGAAIAETLVINGMTVVGLARREERLRELEKKLIGKRGKLYPIKADLSKEEDILKAFEWIENTLGGIHVLVNNAGISRPTLQAETSTETFREVLDVNLVALQICSREGVRLMKAHNFDGYIINISSIIAKMSNPSVGQGTYYASKVAVNAIGEAFRCEFLASNSKIRVTTINPGLCDTEIFSVSGRPLPQSVLDIALQPDDIADAVVYVLQQKPHVLIPELTIKTTVDVRKAVQDYAFNVYSTK